SGIGTGTMESLQTLDDKVIDEYFDKYFKDYYAEYPHSDKFREEVKACVRELHALLRQSNLEAHGDTADRLAAILKKHKRKKTVQGFMDFSASPAILYQILKSDSFLDEPAAYTVYEAAMISWERHLKWQHRSDDEAEFIARLGERY